MPSEITLDIIRRRHSTRGFLPDPVDDATLRHIFAIAGTAPSNCNTQPWLVEVVRGKSRDRLSAALLSAHDNNEISLDYPFDETAYTGVHGDRRRAQGALYYSALGLARDDRDGRGTAIRRNLDFFGAPQVALLFMPNFGVRAAADLGMYAQNLLLVMSSYGLGSVCQTILGFYADTIRAVLGIDNGQKLLFGISFGFEDENAEWNKVRMPRAPLSETTRFHE